MTQVNTYLGDITNFGQPLDAIVNAANSSFLGGGGVDGAIHRAAGPLLLLECSKLKSCETGEAKITGAYELPYQYIIHTVGPIWKDGKHKEAELLKSCYENSLKLAMEVGIRRIAFPSIATGVYHFPVQQAAEIAVSTVKDFVDKNRDVFDEVCWVLFDERTKTFYDMQVMK